MLLSVIYTTCYHTQKSADKKQKGFLYPVLNNTF